MSKQPARRAAGKHDDAGLNLLLWGALGLGGLYLFKRYEREGMAGDFDAEGFIEEGSEIIPHPIAKNPLVKKIAREALAAHMRKRRLRP